MGAADNNLELSPALQAKLNAAAAEEHRSAGEVLSEAIDRYMQSEHLSLYADWEIQQARTLGLPIEDRSPSPDYRATIREKIDQGLESARQGRLVDGEAVFARIEAELVELERCERG